MSNFIGISSIVSLLSVINIMEDINHKICFHCHEDKPFSEYNKCKSGKYGLHGHCRSCQQKIKKAWYIKNQESERAKSRIYHELAADHYKEYNRKRWLEKKHILGPKQNERRRKEHAKIKARIQRKEWISIPQNKIACTLRSRIRGVLKNIKKNAETERLLGCSFEDLRVYLESKFLPGMTWDNYGTNGWHIDHIIPCASFDLTIVENQQKCFHYTNLQPLWAIDNIKKGSKIIN